jgi:uncharacterized protein YjiS (DUF1127 family)
MANLPWVKWRRHGSASHAAVILNRILMHQIPDLGLSRVQRGAHRSNHHRHRSSWLDFNDVLQRLIDPASGL